MMGEDDDWKYEGYFPKKVDVSLVGKNAKGLGGKLIVDETNKRVIAVFNGKTSRNPVYYDNKNRIDEAKGLRLAKEFIELGLSEQIIAKRKRDYIPKGKLTPETVLEYLSEPPVYQDAKRIALPLVAVLSLVLAASVLARAKLITG